MTVARSDRLAPVGHVGSLEDTGREAGFRVGILVAWRRNRKHRGTFGGQSRVYLCNHV